MAWNPIKNFRYAKRGTSGTTAIDGAQRAMINANEQHKQASGAWGLPRRNFNVGARPEIVVQTESFDDYLAHAGSTGVETLVIGFTDGANGNRKMSPKVEAAGVENAELPTRESGNVPIYNLKFRLVGVVDTDTLLTMLAVSAD